MKMHIFFLTVLVSGCTVGLMNGASEADKSAKTTPGSYDSVYFSEQSFYTIPDSAVCSEAMEIEDFIKILQNNPDSAHISHAPGAGPCSATSSASSIGETTKVSASPSQAIAVVAQTCSTATTNVSSLASSSSDSTPAFYSKMDEVD